MSEPGVNPEAEEHTLLWGAISERVESLLTSDKAVDNVRTFAQKDPWLIRRIIGPEHTTKQHQDTSRVAALPFGGGGFYGVRLEERVSYGPENPEAQTKLTLTGWNTVQRPAPTDYGTWQEELLWRYNLNPEQSDGRLGNAYKILMGSVDWEEACELAAEDEVLYG